MTRYKTEATMATHGKIGEFDPSQETWAMYVDCLELYFIANGIEDAGKKHAVLPTVSCASTGRMEKQETEN